MASSETTAEKERVRGNWMLSAPALALLIIGASGPLLIVLVYSFLKAGEYSGVIWEFSPTAWFEIFFRRDIFDGTIGIADAHLSIFWRSVRLSMMTTLITILLGFPTAWFIATRPRSQRALWLFLITIPFWTNLLIRTFAIMEVIRNEGILNNTLMALVRPGLVAGSILVFVPSLGAYVTPRVLGGGKNMMIGNFIELQFGQGRNWPLGAALSMMLLLIVMAALLIYVRASNRENPHG